MWEGVHEVQSTRRHSDDTAHEVGDMRLRWAATGMLEAAGQFAGSRHPSSFHPRPLVLPAGSRQGITLV